MSGNASPAMVAATLDCDSATRTIRRGGTFERARRKKRCHGIRREVPGEAFAGARGHPGVELGTRLVDRQLVEHLEADGAFDR
jgi:hypothetical protein